MSNKDISQMNFKELRNEVQLLRDELAIMQRKYEDMLYNLDNENFSSALIKEKDNMKAEIKINSDEISSKVSNGDFESYKTQTAKKIESKLSSSDAESLISQEADRIKSEIMDDGALSVFEQTGEGFMLDGSRVKFNGVLQIVDENGDPMFSIFRDTNYGNAIYMWSYIDSHSIVLGDSGDKVYLHGVSTGNEIATQGWVQNNNTAKFG